VSVAAAFAVTGRRAMADDVAQDAFERAFAGIDRFDESRPFARGFTGSWSTVRSTCWGRSGGW